MSPVGPVSPATLSGDNVGQSVCIDIGNRERMGLRERDTESIELGAISHDQVFLEAKHAVAGTFLGRQFDRFVEGMRLFEFGTFVPERTGNQIDVSISVEIARCDAVAVVGIRQNKSPKINGIFGIAGRSGRVGLPTDDGRQRGSPTGRQYFAQITQVIRVSLLSRDVVHLMLINVVIVQFARNDCFCVPVAPLDVSVSIGPARSIP